MSNMKSIERIKSKLEFLDEKREILIKLCREVTRRSRLIIMSIQGGKFVDDKALEELYNLVRQIEEYRDTYPEIYFTGCSLNALTEYVEAMCLYNFVKNNNIPDLTDLDVKSEVAYLLGLADLVGELRRYMLNKIMLNDFTNAKLALKTMETIYRELSNIITPEALAPGLRRKVDIMRIVLDNSFKDYLYAYKAFILERIFNEKIQKDDS
ncbi:MAG: hypothetical protein DRI61_11625 [Chloroflexi bacterium]|nr:MAG: hypothetical protein DRI61_11625 [Chloroflexota bacterium]